MSVDERRGWRRESALRGVFEQIDRERDRPLEEPELDERRRGRRPDRRTRRAALDDPQSDERERIERDPGSLERAAERERLARERVLGRRQRVPERDLALLALAQARASSISSSLDSVSISHELRRRIPQVVSGAGETICFDR